MRKLLEAEDGIVLPVAVTMVLILGLLTAVAFGVSKNLNDTSNHDRRSKRALSAAEAGLQVAFYRMNQASSTALPANRCLTTVSVMPVAGECPGQTDALGNGARYTYYVTPQLGAGGTCASVPGVTPLPTDRCITAVGTINAGASNEVSRRVQMRASLKATFTDFNRAGVIGKSLVHSDNSLDVESDMGSNVHVNLRNSITVKTGSASTGKVMLASGGTYDFGNSVNVEGGTTTNNAPFTLPPIDFEFPESNNNNAALPASVFNQTTRVLNIPSGDYTLPAGTYHFCSVTLGNSVKLSMSGSQRTRIFIDSPDRQGTVCGAGTGIFHARNSVEVNVSAGQEELLEILMHGTLANDTRPAYGGCTATSFPGSCKSDFMLDNSVKFRGSIYAPNSTVQAHNSVEYYGAVAADKVRFYNSVKFFMTPDVKNKPGLIVGAADRKVWRECRSAPTVPADPESGCS